MHSLFLEIFKLTSTSYNFWRSSLFRPGLKIVHAFAIFASVLHELFQYLVFDICLDMFIYGHKERNFSGKITH